MTAVMQSSTAAIAVTISAFYAGAIGLEQGAALIIGQNIGTASSSALAAIGASTTAKRLALAYVLFKLIAAVIALLAFPLDDGADAGRNAGARWHDPARRLSHRLQRGRRRRAVCRPRNGSSASSSALLPSKQTALQRALDPSALASPVIAVETARRVVADILARTAAAVSGALAGGPAPGEKDAETAAAALEDVRGFLSELKAPPETEEERLHLTSTLHALDHVSRLVEIVAEGGFSEQPADTPQAQRALELSSNALRTAQVVAGSITAETALSALAAPIGWTTSPELAAALVEVENAATQLEAVQRDHRATTLAAVAPEKLVAADAFARIEAVRRLDRIAHHAWRATAHLLGRGDPATEQGA